MKEVRALSVVVGDEALLPHPQAHGAGRFRLDRRTLVAALVPTAAPTFDPASPRDAEHVLVEVDAFSCNFRDRAILVRTREAEPPESVTPTGSEFCAHVLAVGCAVTDLSVGARVFAAMGWPEPVAPGMRPGVPTSHASRRHHRLHHRQLVHVPDGMGDSPAAAFTLGAQTAYAMVRRLGLIAGEAVLVTAASSSTSQFAISALRNDPAEPHIVALTTSAAAAGAARGRGAAGVLVLGGGHAEARVAELADELGGFAAIVDPYFDLYLPRLARLLRNGGRYVSCGLLAQYEGAPQPEWDDDGRRLSRGLWALCEKNAQFIGNCLGTRADLDRALGDYLAGRLTVPLDTVHTGPPAPFLERSWNDRGRVGKVVYRYER
jgi:NADPH:quinone reductase-like Zn-dependent oxidoreductase